MSSLHDLERCQQRDAPVVVDEGVTSCQGELEGRSLGSDGWMEFNLGTTGLGLGEGGVCQPQVGHVDERGYLKPEDLARNGEHVVELEVIHLNCPPACSGVPGGARDSAGEALETLGPDAAARHAR